MLGIDHTKKHGVSNSMLEQITKTPYATDEGILLHKYGQMMIQYAGVT